MPISGGGGIITVAGGDSQAAINWAARTGELGAPYDNAYRVMLNSLTGAGLFNSNGTTDYFDVFYIYATKDETTALKNIINTNFTGVNANSLTLTPGDGYTGDANNAHFITTGGYNPGDGGGPYKYLQNDCHLSAWSFNDTARDTEMLAASQDLQPFIQLIPRSAGDLAVIRVNDDAGGDAFTSTNGAGHFLGTRVGTASTDKHQYKNGSDVGTTGNASGAINNDTILNCFGGSFGTYNGTMSQMSMGKGMNATQVLAFYNALRQYMTDVGVP